ncbi:MAG: Crp/Fnr family transcriptional regulator [Desulfobulbaceae bacterium]|nr:Crp/Fnr family transcriptional regulator [Desulfobulbaceae bacterium]HIJ78565.1 Crp/Fnr family transcriptional regulator [Deltaproteobacteria bacterium]
MKTRLTSINLLDELAQPEFAELFAELIPRSYPKSSLIYAPGHDRDLVFIVRQGRVRIYLSLEDKEFSLATLEPGDIYTTHTRAHAMAMDNVELLVMPTEKFFHYILKHPALSRTIMSILGDLLKQSFSIIDSLVFKDICQRLTDFFVYEALQNGQAGQAGIRLNLDLTMEQLAAVVGSSRQTVSTIVNDMQHAKVLLKEGRGVYLVPNIEMLKAHCQS